MNIALGNAELSTCPVGDEDGSGEISINEIILAVNNALNGCPGNGPAMPAEGGGAARSAADRGFLGALLGMQIFATAPAPELLTACASVTDR